MKKLEKISKLFQKIRSNLGFYCFVWSLYSLIYISIGVTAILSHRYMQALFLFVTYISTRYVFPKTYHDNNFYHCIFWSCTIFIVAIPRTLNLSVSILSSVMIGTFITGILYLLQDYVDTKTFYMQYKEFNLDTCTYEQIEYICKILKYKKDKIDLAKLFFVDKLSNEEVFEWLDKEHRNVDIDTVRQYRYRILKDLNKFIKL